jgi:hypothetical protein
MAIYIIKIRKIGFDRELFTLHVDLPLHKDMAMTHKGVQERS